MKLWYVGANGSPASTEVDPEMPGIDEWLQWLTRDEDPDVNFFLTVETTDIF